MHQLIDKKIKLFFYFLLFLLLSTQISINNNQKNNFYTSLNIIEVEGLSEKNNLTIYQSLKFLLSKNIFFINKNDIDKIVKKNNLVESFYIKKFYPNLIKVKINQTKLLAITNKNSEKFFIGSNGKLIPTDQIENFNEKLPFVYTNKNYFDFIELKEIIDKSEFKFEEIESFFYFPSNRWDIKTKDGFLIKLPEKKIKESLIFAQYIKTNEKFKDRKIIDLRIPDNIILSNE
tara:strand:+ start:140 stop:835 length:696 start_codon:yes stop_codon:yes gene_type:complete